MTKRPKGPDAPLRDLVNRSGFPFQLAVERDIRSTHAQHHFGVEATELPWSGGFVDLVLRNGNILVVMECKRVDSDAWVFLVPQGQSMNQVGCRLEWYNGSAPDREQFTPRQISKMFCAEFTMCEGSPEASVCIVPKGKGAVQTLEGVCGPLLDACHEIGDLPGVQHAAEFECLVPVVVTNATLNVCLYHPPGMTVETGHVGPSEFQTVDFVRFRKTLVSRRNDDYRSQPVKLSTWAADRERSVFVVNHAGLNRFLFGFRSFAHAGPGEYPPGFDGPI